jgi:hypothetical protein
MSVFQRVHTPSLDGATGWVKSDPLGPAELIFHPPAHPGRPGRYLTAMH